MATRQAPPLPDHDRARNPEVLPPVDPLVEQIAWLMDQAIPLGGRFRIGLDGLLGLVPGLGDVLGTAVGSLIILRAVQAGLPKAAIARMVANTALDTALGAVPFVGDLFDFAYKSNTKNVRIYREAAQGVRSTRRDWGFVAAVLAVLAVLLAAPVVLLILLLQKLL